MPLWIDLLYVLLYTQLRMHLHQLLPIIQILLQDQNFNTYLFNIIYELKNSYGLLYKFIMFKTFGTELCVCKYFIITKKIVLFEF